ncbi:MAG: nicotinate-nucleotide adenylyltransferase [Porticoccaceae bacterium]|jgi:nicotinate-nucleotide adenylyltransferase|nr:nicotinate-nucleotide adenylyltransferase [Porticoccaceae bacterium]
MDKSDNNMAVALFGGTFNPIHNGHLRIATELTEVLQVEHIRIIPCAFPPHRVEPQASAGQRLAMLQAATVNQPRLVADDIELHRSTPSFSIDTVALVREQMTPQQPLFFCIGMDALNSINTWQRWEELLHHCHIVVSSRPGVEAPKSGPVADWVEEYRCDDLRLVQKKPAGNIYFCDLTMLEISSTDIRNKIARGDSINFLTPDAVVEYIQQHHLYE